MVILSLSVIIFSIAELAWASCKLIVSMNSKGLGKLVMAPFNSDNALLAAIVFLKITFDSISAFGGKSGKLLYAFKGLYFIIMQVLNEGNIYTHQMNEGKNSDNLPSFKYHGQNLPSFKN